MFDNYNYNKFIKIKGRTGSGKSYIADKLVEAGGHIKFLSVPITFSEIPHSTTIIIDNVRRYKETRDKCQSMGQGRKFILVCE